MNFFRILSVIHSLDAYFVKPNHGDPFRCPNIPLWRAVFDNVNQAYSQLRQGRFLDARRLLTTTSNMAVADLDAAFDCSIGVSSIYRALANAYSRDYFLESESPTRLRRANQIALRMMHVAMNWLTHAFVKKGINDGKWVDESSWPITIQEVNDEETTIQTTISRLGAHGNLPTWADCPKNYRNPSLRIAIVTMCDYPTENPLPVYSISNKFLYANKWGYKVVVANRTSDPTRPPAWGKIGLLQAHILSDDFDWLLWFDCDTFFMNFNVTLDYILWKYGSVDVGGERILDPNFNMLIQEDHAMLNTGVFFIKTGRWAKQLLANVYGPQTSSWVDHPWWENAAFSHEFLHGLATRMIQEDLDNFEGTDDMRGIYPEGVRVTPQYEFNSYHPITSRVIMHDNYEHPKFVLAFSGVSSGSSPFVVKVLYGNYYRLMCEINNITDQCLAVRELT
jgi:hypothetical protein